jgi:hypothetical protein
LIDSVILSSVILSAAKDPRISTMPPPTSARASNVSVQRLFRIALAASLTVSALLFFVWSWHWPLLGDASLIHYIAFLIERGWASYRRLGDMNMPGSFLIELAAMHVFGMGDLAWRIFDFTLLFAASISFLVIARLNNWLPALFSASLFILIHGRDGITQAGQRDLTMAVCLLAATAFLFLAVRRNSILPATAFGLLSGIACTIKPTAILLTLAQLALAIYALRSQTSAPTKPVILSSAKDPRISPLQLSLSAALAYLIAPAICLVFVLREHALSAFLAGFHGIIPYYASLGHRPLSFVLLHSFSPLLPLVIIWILVLAMQQKILYWSRNWERNALVSGVLFGFINCIVQQRALPYYRYPLLAFLLPLMAKDLFHALYRPSVLNSDQRAKRLQDLLPRLLVTSRRTLAIIGLAFGGFFLAPQSAIIIHRYRWWETDFISTLQQNLNTLGGPSLSGHIQCIDSISGCGNVLYRMRLEPSTGVLSDFLLFGSLSDKKPSDSIPILRETRAEFAAAILAHPPQVIVVTSHLHIDGPDNFEKLARWPAFASFLTSKYTLRTEWSPTRTARWWSREETPASYRIYVLRNP